MAFNIQNKQLILQIKEKNVRRRSRRGEKEEEKKKNITMREKDEGVVLGEGRGGGG